MKSIKYLFILLLLSGCADLFVSTPRPIFSNTGKEVLTVQMVEPCVIFITDNLDRPWGKVGMPFKAWIIGQFKGYNCGEETWLKDAVNQKIIITPSLEKFDE